MDALYALNDLLTAHLHATDRTLDDDALNDLTHAVANAIDHTLVTEGIAPLYH